MRNYLGEKAVRIMRRILLGVVTISKVCMAMNNSCTSEPLELSIDSSTRRISNEQQICLDCAWLEGATRQKLLINGSEVFESDCSSEYRWEPTRQGHYTFTLRSYRDDILLDEQYVAEFDVIGGDLALARIEIEEGSVLYDGERKTPHPIIKYKDEMLIEGLDYVLSWENNINPGTGKIIVTGIGSCYDTVEKMFQIIPAGVCSLDICSGTRVSDRIETLAFDETWIGAEGEGKLMRIMENGVRVSENMGRGVVEWRPTTNGLYTLQYRTYVDGYLESEKYEATFRVVDPLAVVGLQAQQRYPWNGLVDIDFTLSGGGDDVPVSLSLIVHDNAGGTNLPCHTVWVDGVAAEKIQVKSGWHRVTWDAGADLPDGFECDRVSVTVKVTGGAFFDNPKTLDLTVVGYTGTEVLTNVPTLVRLSSAIAGFSYADFATTNGAELAFFTPEGRSLPYEIDEWNTNGESLVWVRLPTLANGTRFTCAYGTQSDNQTIRQSNNPYSVWTEYAGVWHMNEPSGTAFDSTEHGLDALPSCGKNGDLSQMVAYANGACGRARVNGVEERAEGNYLAVPSYDALSLHDDFTVSGWFYARSRSSAAPRLVSRKHSYSQADGWEIMLAKEDNVSLYARGAGADLGLRVPSPLATSGWLYVTACYRGDALTVYTNGAVSATGIISPATDNGQELGFGAGSKAGERSVAGQYDEIRLRGGSLSADRIKADYDMIANREFLSYGAVRAGCEEAAK